MTGVPIQAALHLRAPRKRDYAIAAALVPIVFAILALWLHAGYQHSEALRGQVAQSYERRIAQIRLLSRISEAETAQRGYLLTRNAALLEPLDPALHDIAAQVSTMANGPRGATHVPRIKQLIDTMVIELHRTIVLMRTGHRADALQSISTGRTRRITDRLAIEIGAEIDLEARASKARAFAFRTQRAKLEDFVLLIMVVCAATLASVLALLWNLAAKRHAAILDAFETAKGNAAFFDSTIGAVLIVGPGGKIEVMNAAAVGLLGYYVDENDRRDIATVVDIAPGEGPFHKRLGLVDGQLQRTQLTDRVVRDRLGREVPVDIALGVLHASDGDRVVVSLRDISERKRLDRVKDELMSTVSHEIRTPLTSIVGSLGLLRTGIAGTLPSGATRLIDIAENNSRRLIRLIDDMLDIDRIESGKLRIEREAIDLREVLERARTGSEGIARDHAIVLAATMPDHPVMVSGDADRLLQVISNLLANAIRVAPSGSTVDLSLSIDAAGCALVCVADRGPGVPLAFRTRIFGRFERAARDDSARGTGLGLAISREIVTLHGGRIWFEDRIGGGTSFAFTLAVLDAADDRQPRILICCDQETLCETLTALVAAEGYRYEVVRSNTQAQGAMAARDYAMLLIDLDLPDGGLGLARAARDKYPATDSAIVLLSGARDGDGRTAPLELVDMIAMPGREDRLRSALLSGLARSASERPVVLHLSDDSERLAAVALIAAALEPNLRMVTARDIDTARGVLAASVPDVVVVDLARVGDPAATCLPLVLDAQGVAVPTILYAAQDLPVDFARGAETILIAPAASRLDLAATIRRALPPRATRSEAA